MAVITPKQAAQGLRKFASSFPRIITSPLNTTRNRAVAIAKNDFRSKSPGRSIFSSKQGARAPSLLVHEGRSSQTRSGDGSFTVEMVIEGMAALIEEGGHTRPATIRPRSRKFLKFEGPRGTVFTKVARHPGSRVRRNQIGKGAVETAFRGFPAELDSSLTRGVNQVGLG